MSASLAPLLVLAWGNASRGDDALGPAFIEALRSRWAPALAQGRVELLDDFQLQPEHALDLAGRQQVLLVDAWRAPGAAEPTADAESLATATAPVPAPRAPLLHITQPQPAPDSSLSSHALSPAALLHVFTQLNPGQPLPRCTLLGLRAQGFELGEGLSPCAQASLAAGLAWVETQAPGGLHTA